MELSKSAYTVIVANDDIDGLQARDLALRWHEDGLLDEFAWVTPEDVENPGMGPASVTATVIGRAERQELMTLLGARPRSLIRIVVLHLLTHELADAERLARACNQISDLLGRAMPRQLSSGNGRSSMRLLRINLLVPESDLLPQETTLIQPNWEINAIVSPEDRPDLDRMSVFVRRSVNLHGHGLAAAAAVGGLWMDSPVGAFDGHEADSTTGGGEVVVVRCQARMVVGDDRSCELAGKVAQTVQASQTGAASMLTWGVPADNPQAVVDNAAKTLMESAEWAPQARDVHLLEKAQVSLGVMLRNWAIFQLQLPLAVTKFWTGRGMSLVEQSLTAATVGRDAGEVGRVRPLSPDEARQVAAFRLQTAAEELDPTRLRDEASSWGQTTPSAWRELRELAIGLVDGSRLPGRFSRTSRGGLTEVLQPGAVVPPPVDQLALPGEPPVGLIDVERVAEIAHKLSKAASGDGDTQTGKRSAPPEQDKQPSEQIGTDSDLERLTSWSEQHKRTLLWQVASQVYDFRRQEGAVARSAEEALRGTTPPDNRRLKRAQAMVLGSWLVILIGLLLTGVWAWADSRENPWGLLAKLPDLNWANVAKLVVVLLVVLLLAGSAYFQALRAYEWQVAQRLHTIRTAGDDYVAARQQEKRWELMYRGLQDWGDILSQVLHSPWRTAPDSPDTLGEYVGLPAAVAVAVPVDVDAGPDPRVVTRGVEAVCQPGWLAEEFDRVVSLSPRNDPAAQPHAGDLPADLDLGLRASGPRRELVEVSTSSSAKEAASAHLLEEVAELVREGDVRMPPQTVVRVGPYSAGDRIADREFFGASTHILSPLTTEVFQPAALVDRSNIPERIVFCLPVGLETPQLPEAEVHRCGVSVATRVDVSPLVQPDSITMFAPAPRLRPVDVGAVEEFN